VRTTYRQSRNKADFTLEEAASEISDVLGKDFSHRTLAKYEAGEITPRDTMVLAMGDAYHDPRLTALYCKRECAIGRRYCYEILNNVDLSPVATLAKFQEEEREVDALLGRLMHMILNRRSGKDLSAQERPQLEADILDLLDIEHTIETLKLEMWDFLDVADLVKRHNAKCKQKGYVKSFEGKEKSRLQAAAI
jgi:hypothetical protein